ncbi:MAG: hypothetical protein ACQGVK_09600 [Myxococcota bacterium]
MSSNDSVDATGGTGPTAASTGPSPPEWIRPAHIATLVVLGLCGAVAALQTPVEPEPAPDRTLTWWIAILAVCVIAGRLMAGSPVAQAGLRSAAAVVSLGSAVVMGVLAAHLAVTTGAVRTGVAFAAAALILAIRPPLPRRVPPRRH